MNSFKFSFGLLLICAFLSSVQAADLATNYVTISVSENNIEILHQEASNAANYKSLDHKSVIPTFFLRAGVEKEFLADEIISFTVGVGGGYMFGRKKSNLASKNLQFREEASGIFYGAGGAINANFMIGKMRSQVFGGFQFLKSDSKYKLEYGPMNAANPKVNIDYKEDGTQSYLSAGARFFDAKLGLFSIIAVEYELASSFNSTLTAAKVNREKIDITNQASARHTPIKYTLGFGFTF
jgi:opacity protein-like surface antigen